MEIVALLRKRLARVIPAKAGIQGQRTQSKQLWIPAFAGMTESGEPPGLAHAAVMSR